MNKTYLIVNTSYFGDTLLTSNLIQNIKNQEPTSQIVFLANKPFASVAQSLKGVDMVLSYDKKGQDKGLKGMWNFYLQYKDFFAKKNLAAAFVIYANERGICLAKLWGAKKIFSANKGFLHYLLNNHHHVNFPANLPSIAKRHALLYGQYSKQPLKDYNMVWQVTPKEQLSADKILSQHLQTDTFHNLVALCPISKKKIKDLPLNLAIELIHVLHQQGKKIILLGAGDIALSYEKALAKKTKDFISLVNKTSLQELAGVLKRCDSLISVDTGTMHLGLAVTIPTTCLFFINDPNHLAAWAPIEQEYKCKVLITPIKVTDIIQANTAITK